MFSLQPAGTGATGQRQALAFMAVAIEQGEPISLSRMIFVKAASGGQVWYTGAILSLLMLVWMRAAVIIYALFFGLRPFPGLNEVAAMLFGTPIGWAMPRTATVIELRPSRRISARSSSISPTRIGVAKSTRSDRAITTEPAARRQAATKAARAISASAWPPNSVP